MVFSRSVLVNILLTLNKIILNLLRIFSFFNDSHRENCVLINSGQELIEIEVWLLLTFLLYLHNQLDSIHSKCDSSTAKFVLVFVLIQENAFS